MRAGLLALFFAAFATPAAADRFTLSYDGAALGFIPIGGMTVDADINDDAYEISATLHSGGLLNIFERTNIEASASGIIQNDHVIWQRYDLDHHYSHKHRVIDMSVGGGGVVNAEITPTYRLWGSPPASDAQRRGARDPLSTMVAMAIDVGASHRCAGDYPTFDGRFYYLLELGDGHIDHYSGGGYEGAVLKCSLAYIAVAGYEATDNWRRRIPHGEVWFALAPGARFAPPVHISTPLSAGAGVVRLSRWRRVIVDIDSTGADTAVTSP
jgi:hypothetical protein